MQHLKNSKLNNVTVLTATSTFGSVAAASNRYSDELTFTDNSKTPRILTKFCNKKPLKYRDLFKICNELVKKVKKYGFSDRTQGGQI